MEIVLELIFVVLQFIGEVLIQVILEAIVEFGLHSVRKPFRRPQPSHPAPAAIGYAILGAIAGAISLWIFPALLIDDSWLRVANLVITPIAAGGAMAAIGAWRRTRENELIRLDRFAYGFLFALAMAGVRFAFGN